MKIIILLLIFIALNTNAGINLPVLSGIGGNFSAIDSNNKEIQFNDYKGNVVVMGYGYTNCPDICPFTLGYLKKVYEGLPAYAQKKTKILFVSIDPEYDTPQHLKEFMAHFNKDFIGITGSRENIDQIAELFQMKYTKIAEDIPVEFVDYRSVVKKSNARNATTNVYNHGIVLYLIDTEGDVRSLGYTGTTEKEFIANIRSLLPKPIKIEDFYMNQGAKNARSAAAYGKITNISNAEDVLISVSSPIAKRVELHQTKVVDNFVKMMHTPNKVFKAGETLMLKPMSYHIMFMGLKKPLSEVKVVDISLKFKNAGNIPIRIKLDH
ncbi:Cytochrome oxidase biogenesis protein Sco1/SenC/PrrC, putative copper metallochaperone [Bathymodiolus heckerae thiotrophic gill symbiont]|uniref:SCO family protein n=1 Tax=Bathymodiolus heckerae thiotrophic gill symbiont TaxID=1052212 RepID=UPI0010B01C96|nr:SCO family protein [Bathymodiolus heckerae thiotrophic gill symbiont]SMN12960.1 Cytochrome oxidase biogenesis protein Sco1/SenC/PrrC, putative copper metallochaperone [Bathymodiolus heckerae thiotrophic gill symbiont]